MSLTVIVRFVLLRKYYCGPIHCYIMETKISLDYRCLVIENSLEREWGHCPNLSLYLKITQARSYFVKKNLTSLVYVSMNMTGRKSFRFVLDIHKAGKAIESIFVLLQIKIQGQ